MAIIAGGSISSRAATGCLAGQEGQAAIDLSTATPADIQQRLTESYSALRDAGTMESPPEFGPFYQCVFDQIFADPDPHRAASAATRPLTEGSLRFLATIESNWRAEPQLFDRFLTYVMQARKANPGNTALLRLLDDALANGPGQINAILRGEAGVSDRLVLSRITHEKLAALANSNIYKGGPLEVLTYDLAAIAAEKLAARLLLAGPANDTAVRKLLVEEVTWLQRARQSAQSPDSALPEEERLHLPNDFRFREAFLRLAMGGDAKWMEPLRPLIADSVTWKKDGFLDHVYIQNFVRWPEEGAIRANAELKPQAVKAFYNPAQIALHMCMFDAPGNSILDRLVMLEGHLMQFVNRDFRLFLASSADEDELLKLIGKFQPQLGKSTATWTTSRKLKKKEVATATKSLNAEIAMREAWAAAIPDALKRCGFNDLGAAVQSNYLPFETKITGTWETSGRSDGKTYGIFIGGFLSEAEAAAMAPIIKHLLSLDATPFPARPRING